ncbi:MAG: polysaccharide pyruvyl transferase family protein [Methanobacterium paludis]|nr:polysaccharide pyruvyl transferase family protein [Methanobacterium paludis]
MEKHDPTIGLYGIAGVYNYGCEAIVRGTEIILHKKWPDAHIKYASLRPEDDKKRLKGCDVEIISRKIHRFGSIHRFNGLIAYQTGLYFKKPFQEDLKWIEDCDVIFSIGGDLYTIPNNYKEPKKKYYNSLIHFGEAVKAHEKKFVIWGASIGPFEGYPKAKKAFVNQLCQADFIISREPVTTRYLKSLGIKNVTECADPAFAVPKPKDIKKNDLHPKVHIGINLSPLSSSYSFKSNMNDVIKKQADLVTSLIKEFDAQVTLIPHVVCDFDVNDDDLRYLKQIKSQIDIDVKDHVDLIENDIGFLGTKEILSNCDVVIAARMHCAINAISIGVPTIFLAYSKKAYGMAEYVYGNNKWVIPLKDFKNKDIVELINQINTKPSSFLMGLNKDKKISPPILESIIKQ